MNELPVIVNRHRLKSILILMRRGSCLTELCCYTGGRC